MLKIKMTSTDRILQYIDYKGISKREFYIATGLSNGFLDKTSNVGADKLEKILSAFPDLDLYFVVTGAGEMIKGDKPVASYTITPPRNDTLHEPEVPYKTVTPISKKGVHGIGSVHPTVHPTTEMAVKSIYLTPQFITVDRDGEENIVHVSQKVAAGYLHGYADPEYLGKLPSFRLPGLTDASYRSFEVDGDSMYPTLKNGQMVIGKWVEKLDYIREDRVYIVVHKTKGIIIKRLVNRITDRGFIYCKSDATNDRGLYKTFGIAPEDVSELWYGIFHGSFDFQSPSDMWKRLNNTEADLVTLQQTVRQLSDALKNTGLLK